MGLREEKKAEQRRAILDTAAALFRKRGYEETRIRDIVDRLRISEVTFFNYFPTKGALIMAFAVDMLEYSIASAKRELERHENAGQNEHVLHPVVDPADLEVGLPRVQGCFHRTLKLLQKG